MVVKQLARGGHDVERRVRLGYAAAVARGESTEIGRVLDDDRSTSLSAVMVVA